VLTVTLAAEVTQRWRLLDLEAVDSRQAIERNDCGLLSTLTPPEMARGHWTLNTSGNLVAEAGVHRPSEYPRNVNAASGSGRTASSCTRNRRSMSAYRVAVARHVRLPSKNIQHKPVFYHEVRVPSPTQNPHRARRTINIDTGVVLDLSSSQVETLHITVSLIGNHDVVCLRDQVGTQLPFDASHSRCAISNSKPLL
jgi:hypothetical protein